MKTLEEWYGEAVAAAKEAGDIGRRLALAALCSGEVLLTAAEVRTLEASLRTVAQTADVLAGVAIDLRAELDKVRGDLRTALALLDEPCPSCGFTRATPTVPAEVAP